MKKPNPANQALLARMRALVDDRPKGWWAEFWGLSDWYHALRKQKEQAADAEEA